MRVRTVLWMSLASLVALLLAAPTAAQPLIRPDPYANLRRPQPPVVDLQAEPQQAAPTCATACFQLQWRRLAPVIDVTGMGFFGVEGAAAGVLTDPLDGQLKIYVSHGHSLGDRSVLRIYDIATDTWSFGPSAATIRAELSGDAVGNRHFAIGGRPSMSTVEIFDPTAGGSWSSGAPMPTARSGFAAVALDSRIYAVGGRIWSAPMGGPGLDANEIYDPATDTWALGAPMPMPMGDVYASTALGHRVFVFGGWDGVRETGFTQVYNPMSDQWRLRAPMPTARSNALAGTLAGRAVAIGGLVGPLGTNSSSTEVYDPVLDTWCTGPTKPVPASEIASTGANPPGAIYAIGSGSFGLCSNVHEALFVDQVGCVCPRTQGFWKNHLELWAVTEMPLGRLGYTAEELMALLDSPPRGDASLILAHQLIAAKLNFAAGTVRPDPLTATILDADDMFAEFRGKLPLGVKPSTPMGRSMILAAEILDRFNNGPLGPDCLP